MQNRFLQADSIQYDGFNLEQIAFYGRRMRTYEDMFGLKLETLKGMKVLDCGGGPSSFAAEANRLGIHVTACDPKYSHSYSELKETGRASLRYVLSQINKVNEQFVWSAYSNLSQLASARKSALRLFLKDFQECQGSNRYVAGSLPRLPFADNSFDIVLNGHFLFSYCHMFDYSFILSSILELVRVSCDEVRVYPIQPSKTRPGVPFEKLEQLFRDLRTKGYMPAIVDVPFEFRKSANSMLVISR